MSAVGIFTTNFYGTIGQVYLNIQKTTIEVSVAKTQKWLHGKRIGFVGCRSILCAKSYKIKKYRPTTKAMAASAAAAAVL